MLIFRLCKLGFVIVSTLTKVFFGVLLCVLAEASSSSSGVSSNLEELGHAPGSVMCYRRETGLNKGLWKKQEGDV